MLTLSVRMKFLKRSAVILIAVVLAAITVLWLLSSKHEKERDSLLSASTNEDRILYIERRGWIPETMAKEQTVTIPLEFNDFYSDYNELQKSQGFDLAPYKGSTAVLYLYPVKNYGNGAPDIEAALIVVDESIIGTDLRENSPGGFLLALSEKRKD